MTEDLAIEMEKVKTQINQILKKQQTYCPYSGCFCQYLEHYHIDKDTITFNKPENKMPNPYPERVQKIAKVLLEEIEKNFPGLTKKNFDSLGYPCRKELDEGSPAQQRAEMCIYIELMKAGAFNDQI